MGRGFLPKSQEQPDGDTKQDSVHRHRGGTLNIRVPDGQHPLFSLNRCRCLGPGSLEGGRAYGNTSGLSAGPSS